MINLESIRFNEYKSWNRYERRVNLMKKQILGNNSSETIQSYLDKIEDEEQLKAIKLMNENQSESFLYNLIKKCQAVNIALAKQWKLLNFLICDMSTYHLDRL